MTFENYEGTALDTSILQEVQSEPVVEQTETAVETVEPVINEGTAEITEPETQVESTPEPSVPTEFDVPGIGKVTIEEIKELRQSGLRQSDYTKKTQELARQREQLKDAEEFFNYVKNNPHIIEAMKGADPNQVVNKATPEAEMIRQLAYNQKALEVDMQLSRLKEKYGDIDEIALFQKATELNTDDLEFVYKGLRFENKNLDIDAIVAQAKEQAKAEIKAELEQNKQAVQTIVDTRQQQPVQTSVQLTAEQKRVAQGLGMTEDEYRKWL